MNENIDEYYMMEAIKLAKKGIGFTNPNPLVGAIIGNISRNIITVQKK